MKFQAFQKTCIGIIGTQNLAFINSTLNYTLEFQHNAAINCTLMLSRSCYCGNNYCCADNCCCHDNCCCEDNCYCEDDCCYKDILISSQCSYCYIKPETRSTDLTISQLSNVYSHTVPGTSIMRSTATIVSSLPSTIVTPYISTHPVTNNTSPTITVASVISGVLAVCLLLLLIAISSILASALYRRRIKQTTESYQTDTQGQLR